MTLTWCLICSTFTWSNCRSISVELLWICVRKLKGPDNQRSLINLKGPQQSEGPPSIWGTLSNLKGPRQSKEPHQSEVPPTIWGAPVIRGAPAIWGALSNLRDPINLRNPQQFEGPQQSKGPSAIWKALDNLRGPTQQSECPPAIWGVLSNLKGPRQFEGLTPESCCHFAQAFVQCCQRGQPSLKLLNCSLTIMLCHLHSVMSVLPTCCRWCCQWLLRHSNDHFQNWSASKIIYEVPCQKSGWATNMVSRIMCTKAWHLKNIVDISVHEKARKQHFNLSELVDIDTSFQTTDRLDTCFIYYIVSFSITQPNRQVWVWFIGWVNVTYVSNKTIALQHYIDIDILLNSIFFSGLEK